MLLHFNSHTPHGVRLIRIKQSAADGQFQLTHPTRGATSLGRICLNGYEFQLTHPTRGATKHVAGYNINPNISTHTPHTGCDLFLHHTNPASCNFNSHTPHGVRPGKRLIQGLAR